MHEEQILDVSIKDVSMRLHTDKGVFSKGALDYGTRVLLETIQLSDDVKTVVDMGSGYGPISIYLAKVYPDKAIFAYDVNERAIELTNKNIKENKVNHVKAQVSFLFDNVNHKADAIVTNPPIRAGKKTVFQLYEGAYQALNDHGVLYVVIQKKQGAPSSVEKLQSLFGNCTILERKSGYWILFSQKF
jgi:16S rRNA (guanine1207-N2)-methyltransferase